LNVFLLLTAAAVLTEFVVGFIFGYLYGACLQWFDTIG